MGPEDTSAGPLHGWNGDELMHLSQEEEVVDSGPFWAQFPFPVHVGFEGRREERGN